MDWRTFILGMTKALAWPLALVILLLVVRHRLSDLLSRLLELTFPGGSVKFESGLARVKETAKEAEKEAKETKKEAVSIEQQRDEPEMPFCRRLDLAVNPLLAAGKAGAALAIQIAYNLVAKEVRELLSSYSREPDEHAQMRELARDYSRLGKTLLDWFEQLRELRNAAALYSRQITSSEAVQYLALCKRFVTNLEALRPKPPPHASPPPA
jgi:hypothetical protein